MYWLDGSSKLPFVPHCSYLLSSSRAKKFALAQDLIENQARILKFLVKIGNFDHWCHAASELVDLVLDLVQRYEKYLHCNGILTCADSLHKISDLNSQFVNFVCFLMFELVWSHLGVETQTLPHQLPSHIEHTHPITCSTLVASQPTTVMHVSQHH